MQELKISEEINIEDMIYEIRGKQVMLDSDLAKLFQYETKNLNRQVQRNIERFPDNYCFQLTKEEFDDLRCQNVTSSHMYGGRRYNPYVFTEHGVTMLSGILKSSIAIEMSLKIVNAFITMRKYISTNIIEQKYINKLVLEDHENIKLLQESFNKIEEKQKVNTLFYDGQIYDAYSLLIEILDKAKEEIIIIDNYAGKELLNILKDINKKITIVTSNINDTLVKKYKSQYNNVEFIKNDLFHDRFIIIDRKILYHSGSSFKDLGKKCFAINLIESNEYINMILKKLS